MAAIAVVSTLTTVDFVTAKENSRYDVYAAAQGWTKSDAKRWYELPQGSRLIDRDWFRALKSGNGEQAFSRKRLAGYGYLFRDETSDLPLGFTVEVDDAQRNWVGLNCSACHTSKLITSDAEVFIHGGQTMSDFQSFVEDLITSVDETLSTPQRFSKFAKAVGKQADGAALRDEMKQWLKLRRRIQSAEPKDHRWGRGRADAVGVILAKTSAVISPDSQSPLPLSNAPVSYPFVWNTNQQALLQHNGVVSNGADLGPFAVTKLGALIRNWTEVLGVFGQVKMSPKDLSVKSSINLENLLELEQILARLESPRWPEAFGKLDAQKQKRGEKIYRENCASCHATIAPDDLNSDIVLKTSLDQEIDGPFIYMQPIVDVSVTSRMRNAKAQASAALIGTDPTMACNSTLHTVETGMLKGQSKQLSITGGDHGKYGDHAITTDLLTTLINKEVKPRIGELGRAYLKDQALGAVAGIRSFVRSKITGGYSGSSYDPSKEGDAVEQALSQCADETVLANLRNPDLPLPSYKARPLNGIWATAPYLHNGSVPTLHDLLLPQAKRPASFGYLDGAFDSVKVGLIDRTGQSGASVLKVYDQDGNPVIGNWNGGHEYGTTLNRSDRLDLIEFLKGL